EKRTLEFTDDLTEDDLADACAPLQRALIGTELTAAVELVKPDGTGPSDLLDAVSRALGEIAHAEEGEHAFMGGPSRLSESFDAVETVRSVLSILEQQLVVVTLLRDVLDRGLSVAIGTEHGFEPLSSCAVVVASVSVGDNETGAVGLLGPTRMNYPQALAAAHLVSSELSDRMNEAWGHSPREAEHKGGHGND